MPLDSRARAALDEAGPAALKEITVAPGRATGSPDLASAASWLSVAGGDAMPAFLKRVLL